MTARSEAGARTFSARKLAMSAMCLALAFVLPFVTGGIPRVGNLLCPMHLPVLLCGFVCGWPWGLAVGAIAPLLRMALVSMPPAALAIPMAFELATYGAVSGLLYRLLPRRAGGVYASLVAAMVAGRLVWGAAKLALAGLTGGTFPLSAFLAGAVLTAWPGIAAQLVLVPMLVLGLQKAGLTEE